MYLGRFFTRGIGATFLKDRLPIMPCYVRSACIPSAITRRCRRRFLPAASELPARLPGAGYVIGPSIAPCRPLGRRPRADAASRTRPPGRRRSRVFTCSAAFDTSQRPPRRGDAKAIFPSRYTWIASRSVASAKPPTSAAFSGIGDAFGFVWRDPQGGGTSSPRRSSWTVLNCVLVHRATFWRRRRSTCLSRTAYGTINAGEFRCEVRVPRRRCKVRNARTGPGEGQSLPFVIAGHARAE